MDPKPSHRWNPAHLLRCALKVDLGERGQLCFKLRPLRTLGRGFQPPLELADLKLPGLFQGLRTSC